MSKTPTKCIGFLGWVRGHKFEYSLTTHVTPSQHCLRCGMPRGGWAK